MKVCIPVMEYRGLESEVYGHFGSAPAFVIVDSETMSVERVGNEDHAHEHGQCSPMKALAGARPEAVVVGGIGVGALRGLRSVGIKVYRCAGQTVADAVDSFKNGELPEIREEDTCAGHSSGHSCCH